jgi:hypothetical protein
MPDDNGEETFEGEKKSGIMKSGIVRTRSEVVDSC